MSFTVAIVGRPNVGKSTLFNRLVGKRLAIVDDTPGVTRDRRRGEAHIGDLAFTVIDTAGYDDAKGENLAARMRSQTEQAVAEADAVVLTIDARAGLMPLDSSFAGWLRKSGRPVILVANKSEGRGGEAGRMEASRLGLGDAIAVSAEHGEGLGDLYDALAPLAAAKGEAVQEDGAIHEGEIEEDDEPKALQLAIVGRPNVGKSTLINQLIGEERMLTGPEAGITRDAIAVDVQWQGQRFRMHDTAGLRKRARIDEKLEKLSVADALNAVRFAEVVIVLMDAEKPFEEQ
ncbi:MAG TPA: ribosome biogenesis GTPase Der, partial [Dongiaceae bacterium]